MLLKKAVLLFLVLSSCLFFLTCTTKPQRNMATIPSGDTIKVVKNGDRYIAEIPIEVNNVKTTHKVVLQESRIDTPTSPTRLYKTSESRIDTPGSPNTSLSSSRIDTPTSPPVLYKTSQSRIDTPTVYNFVVEQDCTMAK